MNKIVNNSADQQQITGGAFLLLLEETNVIPFMHIYTYLSFQLKGQGNVSHSNKRMQDDLTEKIA